MRVVWALCLIACGRVGFGAHRTDAGSDATVIGIQKPDAAPVADADTTIDAPRGTGGYTITETTQPYVSPANAVAVPGFVLAADDDNYTIPLPFPFTFYGITYSMLTISMNGFVTFGIPPTGMESSLNDCPLDGTPPDATIAVFWDDLYATETAPTANLVTATTTDTFTIEWSNMDAFYQAGGGNNAFTQGVRVTQQLVLHANGVIDMHYGPRTPPADKQKDCGPDRHLGCSASVGLDAPSSTVLQMVQCGTPAGTSAGYQPLVEGRKITYTPN